MKHLKIYIALLMLFCSVSYSGAQPAVPVGRFEMTKGDLHLDTLPEPGAEKGRIHIRIRPKGRNGASASMLWNYKSPADYMALDVSLAADGGDDLYHSGVTYALRRRSAGRDSVLARGHFTDSGRAENPGVSTVINFNHAGAVADIGIRRSAVSMQIPFDGYDSSCVYGVSAQSDLTVSRNESVFSLRRSLPECPFASEADLAEYLARSENPLESGWSFLDRKIDPLNASLPHFYNLATVVAPDGRILIVTTGGTPKLKGVLTPTIFKDHYDLLWIDATGSVMDSETFATIENGSVLTLSFPLHKSVIRFRRS